jgi:hypothetical protein
MDDGCMRVEVGRTVCRSLASHRVDRLHDGEQGGLAAVYAVILTSSSKENDRCSTALFVVEHSSG